MRARHAGTAESLSRSGAADAQALDVDAGGEDVDGLAEVAEGGLSVAGLVDGADRDGAGRGGGAVVGGCISRYGQHVFLYIYIYFMFDKNVCVDVPSTLSLPAATIGRTPAVLSWLMAELTAADLPPPRLMFITDLPESLLVVAVWATVACVSIVHILETDDEQGHDLPNCIPAITSLLKRRRISHSLVPIPK